MGDVLELKEATVRRGGRNILDHLDWDVNEGERWVVLGPNGAGKTTGQFLADGGSAFELSFGRSGKKVIGTTRGGSLELVDLVL